MPDERFIFCGACETAQQAVELPGLEEREEVRSHHGGASRTELEAVAFLAVLNPFLDTRIAGGNVAYFASRRGGGS